MDNKDIQDFIHFITHSKSMTKDQLRKRDYLLARDCKPNNSNLDSKEVISTNQKKSKSSFKLLSPIDTALFLSLFNKPAGLKYLTHDFDERNDANIPHTLDELYQQVAQILESRKYSLPSSLWTPINNYLRGGKIWRDTFGNDHVSCIIMNKWKEWSLRNNMHPINNPDFAKEIMSFRTTLRLVPPLLKEICGKAKQGLSINVAEENLEKADFYTNTYILFLSIKRIL